MENELEKRTNPTPGAASAAARNAPAPDPASTPVQTVSAQAASAPPKYVVVDRSFQSLCGLFSALFIAFLLFVSCIAAVITVLTVEEESRYSVPVDVKYLTGNRYELITRGRGPGEGLFNTPVYTYVCVRTDADVLARMEHMNALNHKFIPLESPDLDGRRGPLVVYDIPREPGHYKTSSGDLRFPTVEKIREKFEPELGMPLGADCRVFYHFEAPDDIYVCWSPESGLLLMIRD